MEPLDPPPDTAHGLETPKVARNDSEPAVEELPTGQREVQDVAEARKYLTSSSDLFHSAPRIEDLPPMRGVEVAFAGRSNVGKSSLINAVLKRRKLAYTSRTPGRTQLLNFIRVGDGALVIVDMPGYGYAKVGRQQRASWGALITRYLQGRANLARAYLLVDSRIGVGPLDEKKMEMFDLAAVSFQVVLTKIDKLKPRELQQVMEQTQQRIAGHAAAFPKVLATSANQEGTVDELRAAIVDTLRTYA